MSGTKDIHRLYRHYSWWGMGCSWQEFWRGMIWQWIRVSNEHKWPLLHAVTKTVQWVDLRRKGLRSFLTRLQSFLAWVRVEVPPSQGVPGLSAYPRLLQDWWVPCKSWGLRALLKVWIFFGDMLFLGSWLVWFQVKAASDSQTKVAAFKELQALRLLPPADGLGWNE